VPSENPFAQPPNPNVEQTSSLPLSPRKFPTKRAILGQMQTRERFYIGFMEAASDLKHGFPPLALTRSGSEGMISVR